MDEKIELELLSDGAFSVKKQMYDIMNGIEQPIGDPWRRAYRNTIRGREQVEAELPIAQQNEIFDVWGNTPTIEEVSEDVAS